MTIPNDQLLSYVFLLMPSDGITNHLFIVNVTICILYLGRQALCDKKFACFFGAVVIYFIFVVSPDS